MKQIFHTYLEIPILSLVFGIILILGLFYLGKIFLEITKLKLIVDKYSSANYQNILVSTSLVLFLFYPLFLYFPLTIFIFKFFTYFIFILGIFFILNNFIKLKNLVFFYLPLLKDRKNYELETVIIILLLSGLILLSFAPITNADSLDYHLYTAKHILKTGTYPTYLTNFHSSRLAGSGELMISMGLIVGSEQFGSILQTSGLISLIGVLKKYKSSSILWVFIFSSPVLIFFVSSVKPQLLSICGSSFIFSIIINKIFYEDKNSKLENIKEIIFCIFILFINTQVKFSFFLSSFLLLIPIFYYSIKKKLLIKILISVIFLYLLIIFPTIIWKYENFGGNFFELFVSPFTTELHGTDYFKYYLTNMGKGKFLYIIFPSEAKLISQSLGVGVLLLILLFSTLNKMNTFTILMISSFVLLAYNFGQNTARFYLEPYFWLILFFGLKKEKFILNNYFKWFIIFQALIIIALSFYGVTTLTKGVISKNMREEVLVKRANGYVFFKWAKDKLIKLDYKGPVISSKRSIGFLDNIVIPPEHAYLVNLKNPDASPYIDELKRLDPKYFLLSKSTNVFDIYNDCFGKEVFFDEKIDVYAVRNPLMKSNTRHDVQIFEIDARKFPECFSKGTSHYNNNR